jgi:hypothetical protein
MKLSWPIQVGLILIVLLFIWTLYGVYISMSVPEASYQVLETLENGVEIRAYPEEIWATTVAENQNDAFSPLFRYISGDNERGEKIEMTAPVVTMDTETGQFMAFIMPERFDMQSIPRPASSSVKIQLIPPRKLATIRFSGYMTEGSYKKNLELLRKTLQARGISTDAEPLLMQYNDPWTPPFTRRNEIALQVINDMAADT